MQRELVPITLPWKRPRKGLVVAEVGVTFQVERTNRGWQVSVKSGKRTTILARELTRQRDGQCRAEAHAATMPEVLAALANQVAEVGSSEPAGRRNGASSTTPGDPESDARPESTPVAPASPPSAPAADPLDYSRVDDGCICGRASSGTWAADPRGHIALPTDTPPEEAEQIRRFAADYFDRQAHREASANLPVTTDAAATGPAANGGKNDAPRWSKPQPTPSNPKAASKKGATKKAAAKKNTAKKAASKSAKSKPAQTKIAALPKPTAAERLAKARAAKAAKAQQPTAMPKVKGKRGSRASRDDAAADAPAAVPTSTRSTPRAAKGQNGPRASRDDATADAPTAPDGAPQLQWFQVEGRPRANTPFGSFAIEPEGDRQALYFYDLNGMSTFVADRGDLRQIAGDRAARGGVRPSTAQRSPELEAQMRSLFFAEDVR